MAKNRRLNRDDWTRLITEMDESGMTQSAWCKEHDINYRSMQTMKATLKAADEKIACQEDRSVHEKAPEGFIRVIAKITEPEVPPAGPELEFHFGTMVVTVRVEP